MTRRNRHKKNYRPKNEDEIEIIGETEINDDEDFMWYF